MSETAKPPTARRWMTMYDAEDGWSIWDEAGENEIQFEDISDEHNAVVVENERLREALETISEEQDAGRHDGLPEPCPVHDADTMFAIARAALAAPTVKP